MEENTDSGKVTVQNDTKLSLPLAIVVAGALIAGAIYLSRGSSAVPSGEIQKEPEVVAQKIMPINEKDHFIGNPDAPVTIVEYSDLECPYCKRFHDTMKILSSEFGKKGQMAWVFRHFPLVQLHSKAMREAQAVECVHELSNGTATWNYLNRIFEITPANNGLTEENMLGAATKLGIDKTKLTGCLDSERTKPIVDAHMKSAIEAGGRGTPFSIMFLKSPVSETDWNEINGKVVAAGMNGLVTKTEDSKHIFVSGAIPVEFMRQLISILID